MIRNLEFYEQSLRDLEFMLDNEKLAEDWISMLENAMTACKGKIAKLKYIEGMRGIRASN